MGAWEVMGELMIWWRSNAVILENGRSWEGYIDGQDLEVIEENEYIKAYLTQKHHSRAFM